MSQDKTEATMKKYLLPQNYANDNDDDNDEDSERKHAYYEVSYI